tara:strand:- start:2169 stop:2339 length:171 start_codon:yes stop_codon:yes gene_type:complete
MSLEPTKQTVGFNTAMTNVLSVDLKQGQEYLLYLVKELQQEVATLKEQLNTIGKNI